MEKIIRGIISLAAVLVLTISISLPAFANSCTDWRMTSSSNRCGTPICSGSTIPTYLVNKTYTRTCMDPYGNTTPESRYEETSAGCC